MQITGSPPQPAESEALGWGPAVCVSSKPCTQSLNVSTLRVITKGRKDFKDVSQSIKNVPFLLALPLETEVSNYVIF